MEKSSSPPGTPNLSNAIPLPFHSAGVSEPWIFAQRLPQNTPRSTVQKQVCYRPIGPKIKKKTVEACFCFLRFPPLRPNWKCGVQQEISPIIFVFWGKIPEKNCISARGKLFRSNWAWPIPLGCQPDFIQKAGPARSGPRRKLEQRGADVLLHTPCLPKTRLLPCQREGPILNDHHEIQI